MHLLPTLLTKNLAAALFFQARRPSTTLAFVRHLGGIGLLPLAILDSSIVPTFGSLDLLTAWLAARNSDFWPYYASMSTAGAIIGSYITYRMGQRMGAAWIGNKIGEKRSLQVARAIEHWGFGAIFVPTIAPPPFPTAWFLLVAGAFRYPAKKFFSAVLLGRSLRYSLITMIAAHYGRRFVRVLRHPDQYLAISLAATAILIVLTLLFYTRHKWQWRSESTTEA